MESWSSHQHQAALGTQWGLRPGAREESGMEGRPSQPPQSRGQSREKTTCDPDTGKRSCFLPYGTKR